MQTIVLLDKIGIDGSMWVYCFTVEKKLQDIIDGVGLVEKYLKDAGISTPKEIQDLAKPLTSFKFYQTCVKYMSNLLDNVCHSTDRPVASKVTEIKC